MFACPYTWQDALVKQTEGDMALLTVVNSRSRQARDLAVPAVFAVLIHCGMPYRIHDLAEAPLTAERAAGYRAVLLAQEGVSGVLDGGGRQALLAALASGTGLVSFDHTLPVAAADLAQALGLSGGSEQQCTAVRTPANDHYVTHTRVAGDRLTLLAPVMARPAVAEGGQALLTSDEGAPLLLTGRVGAGRWVHWCLAQQVWLNDYLGHANGLDDAFWRAIAWAARKPFAMKAMPPFTTMRIDDAQGLGGLWWNVQQGLTARPPHLPEPLTRLLCAPDPGRGSVASHFGYVEVFNRHGFIPAIGLYLDQIDRADLPLLKHYAAAGQAEFSVHAFSEHTDYDRGRVTEFLYHKGWHDGPDGEVVVDEYTAPELALGFNRADRFWAEAGIRPSRVANTHYLNPGVNSLPFLKARGHNLIMFAATFGAWYDSHYRAPWSRAPYGSIGLVLDYLPVPEGVPGVGTGDFFCAEAHVYDTRRLLSSGHIDDGDIDFTQGRTMKGCARDDNDLQAAADNIVQQVSGGLSSLFFGCGMAHEQGVAVLTPAELDEIMTVVERALARFDMLPATYEHIAEYAQCKVDSHVATASEHEGRIALRLTGRSTLPLQLYVFADEGDGCRYHFATLSPFAGALSAEVS
ncbi:MAG: hypothetical protein ACYC5O_07185 [Anaerolineae bacterium]